MKEQRPSAGGAFSSGLPAAPLDVAIVGAGRVGCSIARALAARGHRIVAVSVAQHASAQRVLDVVGPVPIANQVTPSSEVVMATSCPLCHINLDLYQGKAEKTAGQRIDLPILHLPQLVGLAIGISPERLRLKRHIVSPKAVLERVQPKEEAVAPPIGGA